MTMDISDFYLTTSLKHSEHIRVKLNDIQQEIIYKYNLEDKATTDGSIHIVANKKMYGLPQAGLLANKLFQNDLTRMIQTKQSGACSRSMIDGQYNSQL